MTLGFADVPNEQFLNIPTLAGTAWSRLDQPSKSGRREMATRGFPRGALAKVSSEHAVAKP